MRPYYEDGAVTLYHADCLDLLESLWFGVDLLLTDPPYGMNHEPTRRANGSKRWGAERIQGDDRGFDPTPFLRFPKAIMWGGNWYASRLPDCGGWFVWDKTPKGRKEGFTSSDAELAWTNIGGTVRKFSLQWGGEARDGEGYFHPTQKPVALMRWCIEQAGRPTTVLDPFAGAGPTLVAAKAAGCRAIGIELEERYCEVAAARLSQGVLPLEAS